MDLPISREILEKYAAIPRKISEISYLDQDKAVEFLREWGEMKYPITVFWDRLTKYLNSVHKT